MEQAMRLCDLKPGEAAAIEEVGSSGTMRRRLLDIGFVKHKRVECLGKSPGGGMAAYLICGAVIAIRREDGRNILVTPFAGEAGK